MGVPSCMPATVQARCMATVQQTYSDMIVCQVTLRIVLMCMHSTAHAKAHACAGGSKGITAKALFLLFVEAISVVASRRPAKRARSDSAVDDVCVHVSPFRHCTCKACIHKNWQLQPSLLSRAASNKVVHMLFRHPYINPAWLFVLKPAMDHLISNLESLIVLIDWQK